MEYKTFKNTKLSRLGMGNMRLPTKNNDPSAAIDREKAQEIIDYAVSHGITYFDTAYVYHNGESESFLGDALKKYPKDSYQLATKFFLLANSDYKAVFEEQLSRLQTDYIDFYLIHAIFDHTYQQYIDSGCIQYFLEQKKAGRIKYLGFSSHALPENMEKFIAQADWDFAQIQLNYFDWNYGHAQQEYEILKNHGIPIMVMEPVRGGRLAKLSSDAEALLLDARPTWSTASWALYWIKSLPQVQVVLSGMSTLDQIKENVETFSDGCMLSKEEETILFDACDRFKKQVSVPCTACRYCCDGCPKQIEIPNYLTVYNSYKTDGPTALNGLAAVESKGKPSDCIHCGACTEHCPQDISIPEILEELSALGEKQQ